MTMAPANVRAELAAWSLKPLGINTPPGRDGESGLAAISGREQEWASGFAHALDYAVAIGARSVHCLAGSVPPEQRPAAETVHRPGYFLNRVEHAADIVGKIGAPNLRIQFDFYHVQIVSGDLIRRFEAHRALIGHVQIAGVPLRREPDEGEVNYPEIFAALDRLGYDDFVGCEYRPRGRTEDGLGWAKPYGIVPKG